jgi:hypothetical protein
LSSLAESGCTESQGTRGKWAPIQLHRRSLEELGAKMGATAKHLEIVAIYLYGTSVVGKRITADISGLTGQSHRRFAVAW